MGFLLENYIELTEKFNSHGITLVAVSKKQPISDILSAYHAGQRDFGENYVQEIIEKQLELPEDIKWHFIGHLQSNKVKYIAPFVHMIQGVDSEKLLVEINKQGIKNNRIISCLLQVHIAVEETKFGFNPDEVKSLLNRLHSFSHVKIQGLMGMASFTTNTELIRQEFSGLKKLFDECKLQNNLVDYFDTLSMGMSSDYEIAVKEGSTMVRVGSKIFGERKN